jgi:hypothetical protein
MHFQRLIGTDRGDLSLVVGEGSERRLRRCLRSSVASREFRHSVDDLAAHIRAHLPARLLPVLHHEQIGDHYFIDYGLDGEVQTVPEYFAQAPWLKRLRFAADALARYDEWRKHVPAPVGLHAGRLVACRISGGPWLAYLAPCPLPLAPTYNLLEADPAVLASIAPERVRGVSDAGFPEDVYAAGTLVLEALGSRPRATGSAAGNVELQARSALLPAELGEGAAEPALRQIPFAAERLAQLENVARRSVHFDSRARPANLQDLRQACELVLALEAPAAVARQLEAENRLSEALRLLEWSLAAGRENEESLRLAVSLTANLGLMAKELLYLERVLRLAPCDYEAARRRWKLRYEAYLRGDPPAAGDPEGDWLLSELRRLRLPTDVHLSHEGVEQAKGEGLCAAMIHGRRGDLHSRARELYQMTKLDFQDIEALLLYGLSLREMADRKDAGEEYRGQVFASLRKLFGTVSERLRKLKEAERLDEEDVREWTERFQFLLLS